MENKWDTLEEDKLFKILATNPLNGLEHKEAQRRLKARFKSLGILKFRLAIFSWLYLVLEQFISLKSTFFLLSAILLLLAGELKIGTGLFISFMLWLFFSSVLAHRLQRIEQKISTKGSKKVLVIRQGQEKNIPLRELVLGDLVLLQKGDIVPANLRLLKTNELVLKGDSYKPEDYFPEKNLALVNSLVLEGQAKGMVLSYPMEDANSNNYRKVKEKENFKNITLLYLILGIGIFILSYVQNGNLFLNLAISLGLMAIGVKSEYSIIDSLITIFNYYKISKRKVGINSFKALNNLGNISVACFNQIGTLTKNILKAEIVFLDDNLIEIEGEGYDPKGKVSFDGIKDSKALDLFYQTAALCNNASLYKGDVPIGGWFRSDKDWNIKGDSLDGAMVVMSAKNGIWKEILEKSQKRIYEIPFNSYRKMMSVLYKVDNQAYRVYSKGALEVVIDKCINLAKKDQAILLGEDERKKILEQASKWRNLGYRVLALAYKDILISELSHENKENFNEENLVFLGIVAIRDSVEEDFAKEIQGLAEKGIRTICLSGEHPLTLEAYGGRIGLLKGQKIIFSGEEMDLWSDKTLLQKLSLAGMVARVNPEQKQRIIRVLKEGGEVVSYVGEDMADILALNEAQVNLILKENEKLKEKVALSFSNLSLFKESWRESRKLNEHKNKISLYQDYSALSLILLVLVFLTLGIGIPFLPVQFIALAFFPMVLCLISLFFREERALKEVEGLKSMVIFTLAVSVGIFIVAEQNVAKTMLFQGFLWMNIFYALLILPITKSILKGILFFGLFQITLGCFSLFQYILELNFLTLGHWFLIYSLSALPFLIKVVKYLLKNKIMYLKV